MKVKLDQRITVRLSWIQKCRIAAMARAQAVTPAEIVRRIIAQALDG